MPEFTVNIANLNFKVKSIYDFSYKYCKNYLTEAEPDYSFEISEKDIDFEIELSENEVSRDFAESIAVYRKIAERLPFYNSCVFHGAAIEYEGRGIIFTAPSGTGKTTHIMLWKKFLGDKVNIINGDKPVLNIDEDITIYSTPYAGKERIENHSSCKLNAICIIKRGTENKIEKVSGINYIIDIMRQLYKPYDIKAAEKTLELLDLLIRKTPLYVLYCDMSEYAVKCSFEELTGLSFNERRVENEN